MSRRPARLIGLAVIALAATGCWWHHETLDGNGGPNGRIDADVGIDNTALVYNARPHVFYLDATNATLRHGYYNGQFWAFEILDGNGGPNGRVDADVGYDNAAILYNNRPHIFYGDDTNGTLRHAYWNGLTWIFETLDGNGGPNGRVNAAVGYDNAAILYNNRPHIFYGDATNGTLRHGYYNGQFWAFETLDGNGGPNGRVNAAVGYDNSTILYNNRPHIFYGDATNLDLRHGYWNGSFWAFEILDGDYGTPWGAGGPGEVGGFISAIISHGVPNVFYYDFTNGDLRTLAYYGHRGWQLRTIDGHATGPNGRIAGDVGLFTTSIIYSDRIDIFYWDLGNGTLRHGYLD